jgi:hypothetical protein
MGEKNPVDLNITTPDYHQLLPDADFTTLLISITIFTGTMNLLREKPEKGNLLPHVLKNLKIAISTKNP